MNAAHLPAFTFPDPKLIRSDQGRDPLGLQPIWSGFGRVLVPNLAGPVGQISGITAILLIHYLSEGPLAKFMQREKVDFRAYFRLMEGLIEWHLWSASPTRKQHCFGAQTFGAGAQFAVTAKDSRTVVNGLHQYYRGTCARAGLLLANWSVAPDVAKALATAWTDKANADLERALLPPLQESGRTMIPSAVLDASPQLRNALSSIFNPATLNTILNARLFGDASHRALASHCASLMQQADDDAIKSYGRTRTWIDRLPALLAEPSPAHHLLAGLEHVTKCEPFLITVQDCFDYLRCSAGASIDSVVANLHEQRGVIQGRGASFLELEGTLANPRMKQMLELADAAAREGTRGFLAALLEHHATVMRDRGRDPMVMTDLDKILVVIPTERDKTKIQARLTQGYPWENSYYLATAANIFQQASKVNHG